jgi:hypothetical protein
MTIAMILKRLYQAPRNRVHQKSFRAPLFSVLICFLIALAFSSAYGQAARTQQKGSEPGRAVVNPPVVQQVPMDLERYYGEGYSVHGPAKLHSVNAQALVFAGEHGKEGLTVRLANKTVVVLDEAGNSRKFSALGPDVTVAVCNKQDRVVIFVVTPQQRRSRHAQ